MSRRRLFMFIAELSAACVVMVPIALCFGLCIEDKELLVHRMFETVIYGTITFIVSYVIANID